MYENPSCCDRVPAFCAGQTLTASIIFRSFGLWGRRPDSAPSSLFAQPSSIAGVGRMLFLKFVLFHIVIGSVACNRAASVSLRFFLDLLLIIS
jgi:hypothetical protein